MKPQILPLLLSVAAAWVIPDEQLSSSLTVEDQPEKAPARPWSVFPSKEDLIGKLKGHAKKGKKAAKETFDDLYERLPGKETEYLIEDFEDAALYVSSWLDTADSLDYLEPQDENPHPRPPPHHPPGKRPKHPPHPPKRPHHPPHHGKPNETVYQIIANFKHSTKLTKLINLFPEVVELLNSTASNFTIFAPVDSAFEKIPKHGKRPSDEIMKKVLLYHVAPGVFPAGRVLYEHTVPTALEEPMLDAPQRIAARLSLRGPTLNFYSRIFAPNVVASNGIIHGINSILLPPPKAITIVKLLPGDFSTLTLGLSKTGLLDVLSTAPHVGGTLFAPSNWAFKKLGPRINAFLFSKVGEKHLKALLKYHVVSNETVYSTAYVNKTTILEFGQDDEQSSKMSMCPHFAEDSLSQKAAPSYYHFDLPTLLDGQKLSVDIGRVGPFVSYKVNGFVRVVVQDGIAKDGVIQVPSDILIPPRRTAGSSAVEYWNGEELDLEDFKQRFEPFLEDVEREVIEKDGNLDL